ncbi:hypothetical protein [Clostridium sp. DL1XJH146]
MDKDIRLADSYDDEIHKLGRITGLLALLLIFIVPTMISIKFNIFPPTKNLLIGVWSIAILEIPVCIAEVLTYTPLLGTGASYLAFVSGNLTNLKIPCASMSMEIAEVKPGTKEGDIISTISVATSTMVTEIIIIVGVLAIVPLTPVLSSEVLKPAFDNVLPALFGALGVYWILKQWKLAVAPLLFSIIILMVVDINIAVIIPVAAVISIVSARALYKKGLLDKKK